MKIITFKKKKKVTNKRAAQIIWNAKICFIYKENLQKNIWTVKNIVMLEIIFFIQENIELLRTAYVI